MSNHLLIKLSTRKPYLQTPKMPKGSQFDHNRGVWMKNNHELINHDSEYGIQATKKCDVETGEDQKGE